MRTDTKPTPPTLTSEADTCEDVRRAGHLLLPLVCLSSLSGGMSPHPRPKNTDPVALASKDPPPQQETLSPPLFGVLARHLGEPCQQLSL